MRHFLVQFRSSRVRGSGIWPPSGEKTWHLDDSPDRSRAGYRDRFRIFKHIQSNILPDGYDPDDPLVRFGLQSQAARKVSLNHFDLDQIQSPYF
jgi:hypothetical protein